MNLSRILTNGIVLPKIFGIPVILRPSWLGFMAMMALLDFEGFCVVMMAHLFVLLHEFGHVAAARRCGVRTRCIFMSVLGGMAMLERVPKEPLKELYITICGPAVNLLLATVFSQFDTDICATAAWINVVLAVFNLLPAYPMDGGRILRAMLTLPLGRLRATKVVVVIALTLFSIMAAYGLYTLRPLMVGVAAIMSMAAWSEYIEATASQEE